MNDFVVKLPIEEPADVFHLRQTGREAAAALGCDQADQVRLATALSELGREVLAHGATSYAGLTLEAGALVIEIVGFPRAAARTDRASSGLDAARRLVDGLLVSDGDRAETVTIRLVRAPHAPAKAMSEDALRAAIARSAPLRPLDELRLENRDLIATLERLEVQQSELVRLNAELEETNRGVMAMYSQLADELEETNRGVVALYAELDDKTVRLNAASESKSRFLASVSHELRGPVHSILGLSQVLLDPSGDSVTADQRKQLELVTGSGRELLRLVNDLLDLAKAESGKLEPEPIPVDLPELFSELRGSLRPMVPAGVSLNVAVPDWTVLETDRTMLGQVLRNLLTNALKFTTRGEVRLSAVLSAPHEIELTVMDTGIGISPENQSRVFEEFFQVRGPLQARSKGTGLGLPYVRRVTETLGGQLRLSSEIGRGSSFTVTLPLHWQPLLTSKTLPDRETAPVSVGTVLIVDDDGSFRTALRGMLQGAASQVIEAGGGEEGLRLMRNAPPDLLFLDLRMPDMDGGDVLAAMNADPKLRTIPVIMVTSSELNNTSRAALSSAVGLLAKANVDRDSVQRALAVACA